MRVKVFSIRHNGRIKAALIVDTSDMGVNMSELLNSIKIIVIDNTLPWSILQDAVSTSARYMKVIQSWFLFSPSIIWDNKVWNVKSAIIFGCSTPIWSAAAWTLSRIM